MGEDREVNSQLLLYQPTAAAIASIAGHSPSLLSMTTININCCFFPDDRALQSSRHCCSTINIKDVDEDLNRAFNSTNLDFLNNCVRQTKGTYCPLAKLNKAIGVCDLYVLDIDISYLLARKTTLVVELICGLV